MKTLTLKRRTVERNEWLKHTALEKDFSTLIEEPTIVVDADDGEIKIIFDVLDFDTRSIVAALKGIKYHEGYRTRGLLSTSRIFGYRPRSEMRGDFCSVTSMAVQFPQEHALVARFALQLEKYYRRYHPGGYKKHLALTEEQVKPSYRIEGQSVFTSGIINKNNPLKYHNDTGNFKDVYSCMVVFKDGVEGGGICRVLSTTSASSSPTIPSFFSTVRAFFMESRLSSVNMKTHHASQSFTIP